MANKNIKIRRAQAQDTAAITECVISSYRHYTDRIGKPPGPMLENYNDVIRHHSVFVMLDETEIVGLLVLILQPTNMLLDNIAVLASHQGRGLGRELMLLAEQETLRCGLGLIRLYTHETMVENIEIYKKLGYIEVQRKLESGYSRIYMQKELESKVN